MTKDSIEHAFVCSDKQRVQYNESNFEPRLEGFLAHSFRAETWESFFSVPSTNVLIPPPLFFQ